jgi:hypothetical protein
MKFTLSLASLVAVASAFPVVTRDAVTTRTELEDGISSACPKAILIYARGTLQDGNMVSIFFFFIPGTACASHWFRRNHTRMHGSVR